MNCGASALCPLIMLREAVLYIVHSCITYRKSPCKTRRNGCDSKIDFQKIVRYKTPIVKKDYFAPIIRNIEASLLASNGQVSMQQNVNARKKPKKQGIKKYRPKNKTRNWKQGRCKNMRETQEKTTKQQHSGGRLSQFNPPHSQRICLC